MMSRPTGTSPSSTLTRSQPTWAAASISRTASTKAGQSRRPSARRSSMSLRGSGRRRDRSPPSGDLKLDEHGGGPARVGRNLLVRLRAEERHRQADGPPVARIRENLTQHARLTGPDFYDGLVGFELNDQVADSNGRPGLLMPLEYSNLIHAGD